MKAKCDISDTNVIPELSRQYKTMQTELTGKVTRLENEVSQLKGELSMTTFKFPRLNYKDISSKMPKLKVMACHYASVCLLVACQEELKGERGRREQVEQEKDAAIAELQNKLDNMETGYEKILHVSYNKDQFKQELVII